MPAEIVFESVPEAAADKAIQAASDRRKLVLVVVLLIGLGIAIVTQPKNPELTQALIDSTEGQASVSASADRTDDRESPSSVASHQQDLSRIGELSRIDLGDILRTELFVVEPAGRARPIEINPTRRVRAIYGNADRRSALLDEEIIRDGQPLPDGGKTVDVTSDGIQVWQ
jgi:hypothetical protein